MNNDPGTILDEGPMHRLQVTVVALCIALTALDGFDVLAISFAAPGIAAEWGIDRGVLGVVLSMELLGMALGSVLIGNLADRIGRRPTILGCLVVMTAGMLCAAFAADLTMLSATRFVTGLGIGGMLSSTSAMVAEFSSARRRGMNLSFNIAGYSVGAILGGMLASLLLADAGDWRRIFLLGAGMTAVLLPVAVFALPESIGSLASRRPADALARINAVLARLGRAPLGVLPQPQSHAKPSIATLFSPDYLRPTVLLTFAYFAQIMLFYYVQKWVPKIVVDMGFTAAEAGRVLVCANVGTLSGAVAIGLASQKLPMRQTLAAVMAIGFGVIALLGVVPQTLTALSLVVGVAGFFINAGVVGLYPVVAGVFPATIRASGTGFVIGVGRGGSALGPVIAGALFAGGGSLELVSLAMGAGGLVAAAAVLALPRR